jgi:hypothetical protein
MTYLRSSFDFAGVQLDGFIIDGKEYVTLSSLVKLTSGSRQNGVDWGRRHNSTSGIQVKVGRNNVPTTAYPISVAADYLMYRAELGDKLALATLTATFQADLERSIRETNGLQVTAAAHESNRANIRQHLVDGLLWAYQAVQEATVALQLAEGDEVSVEDYQVARSTYLAAYDTYRAAKSDTSWTSEEAQAVVSVQSNICL